MRNAGSPDCRVPKKLARPAQLQIHFGDVEAVGGINQRADALPGRIAQLVRDQNAVALRRSAADTPAQLMDLRQPKSFRMLDHHDGRVRNIHAHLDDRSRDQDLRSRRA